MAQQNDPLLSSSKNTTPKDTQVMASILKEMGINDYEPRILNQMLEFTYRYVSNVIDDALLYSAHAKKKSIDSDDVTLAISLLEDRNFTQAPNRDVTVEMARQRNNITLPVIKSSAGLRLPADRYSLTACNYRLKTSKKPRTVHTVSRLNVSNSVSKGSPAITSLNKVGSIASIVTKASTPSTPIIARPVTNGSKPATTPIIKFTDGNRIVSTASMLSPMTTTVPSTVSLSGSVPINLPTQSEIKIDPTLTKKQEDDDYDMV